MMEEKNKWTDSHRLRVFFVSLMVAITAVFVAVQVLFAAGSGLWTESRAGETAVLQDGDVVTQTLPANTGTPLNFSADDAVGEYLRAHTLTSANAITADDLAGSTKTVVPAQSPAGTVVNYTIVVSNSTGLVANSVAVTDTLGPELAYVAGTLLVMPDNQGVSSTDADIAATGVITWAGVVLANDDLTISFSARLTDTLAVGSYVTNTVQIDGGTAVITREAGIQVTQVNTDTSGTVFMPIIVKPLEAVTAQITRADSQNRWTVSWTDNNSGVIGYEIQESQDPSFGSVVTRTVAANVSSTQFQQAASTHNMYYYRVRALSDDAERNSDWSNTVTVIGAYLDNFDDPGSGWAIRRTTYLEEVRSWYETYNGQTILVMQVEDSWDWGITAPYKVEAPPPPYAIEYRAQTARHANLLSHGAVFGADWPGGDCPDYSSLDGLYRHQICFNHFYNTNIIYYGGALKLLFERVDYLEWRPQDGGSPMKRGSFDDYASWFEVDPIPGAPRDDWNTFRVEVRDSGIKLFVNGSSTPYAVSSDNLWVNEPYFGIFVSADEYSNSTWRFDYYQVTPLDN